MRAISNPASDSESSDRPITHVGLDVHKETMAELSLLELYELDEKVGEQGTIPAWPAQ